MKSIVMDTSNQFLAIALYDEDVQIDKIQVEALKKQSEWAIPYLQQLLEKHQWTMYDVSQMIISIGPGSYTGVRIALTIAKTLATILPIQIKAISSLALLVGMDHGLALIDARGHKYYVGYYDRGKALMQDCLMDEETWQAFLMEHKNVLVYTYQEDIDLCDHLYTLSKLIDPVKDVDGLVPSYIKEVEAKKQCL